MHCKINLIFSLFFQRKTLHFLFIVVTWRCYCCKHFKKCLLDILEIEDSFYFISPKFSNKNSVILCCNKWSIEVKEVTSVKYMLISLSANKYSFQYKVNAIQIYNSARICSYGIICPSVYDNDTLYVCSIWRF